MVFKFWIRIQGLKKCGSNADLDQKLPFQVITDLDPT